VQQLENTWFENRNGQFVQHTLPMEAQIAPTFSVLSDDFNRDGHPDLLRLLEKGRKEL
jgi:hypothetical protein